MWEIIGLNARSPKMAELHMHSAVSQDAKHGRRPEELVDIAVKFNKLNALAVTDHDGIRGSLIARDYARRQNIDLEIPGASEISSKDGHVVALYIEQDIEAGLSVIETIRQIHRQGGLAIAAHPLYQRISGASLGRDNLLVVAEHPDPLVYWDAVELFNAGAQDFARGFPNEQAISLFQTYPDKFGAPIGCSDGHGYSLGRAVTTYEGNLKQAIKSKNTGIRILDQIDFKNYLLDLANEYGSDLNVHFERWQQFIERYRISQLKNSLEAIAVEAQIGQTIDTGFLSPAEQVRFLSLPETKKLSWAASRLALKLAYGGVTGLPLELLSCISVGNQFDKGRPSGPPFISANPSLYYSLSHSGSTGAGVVSSHPVGVDIETIVSRKPATLKGIADIEEIKAEDDQLTYDEIVTRLWALKEAVIKGTQIGISLRDLKVKVGRIGDSLYKAAVIYKGSAHSEWYEQVFRKDNYYLAVAAQENYLPVGIKWCQLPSRRVAMI